MRIYKYRLPDIRGKFKLSAHQIEQITHIAVINDLPYFWAVVNDNKEVEHIVHAIHTGEDDEHFAVMGNSFIGTALLDGGRYVLHYYIEEL